MFLVFISWLIINGENYVNRRPCHLFDQLFLLYKYIYVCICITTSFSSKCICFLACVFQKLPSGKLLSGRLSLGKLSPRKLLPPKITHWKIAPGIITPSPEKGPLMWLPPLHICLCLQEFVKNRRRFCCVFGVCIDFIKDR